MGGRVASAASASEALDRAFEAVDEANNTGRALEEVDPDAPPAEGGAGAAPEGDDGVRRARKAGEAPEAPVRRETEAEQHSRRREVPKDEPAPQRRQKPAGEAEGDEEAPADAPKAEGKVRLDYRGRHVDVDPEELVMLAQRGLDYNERMREVGEMKRQISQDQAGFSAYNEFRGFLKEHPSAAKLISGIISHVDEKGVLPAVNFEQEDPTSDPTDRIPPWAQSIMQRLDRFETHQKTVSLAEQLDAAVESNPILRRISEDSLRRSGGKKDLALQKLHDALKADPGANLRTLARTVATELEEVAETLGVTTAYVEGKERDTKRFGHVERPDVSPPEVPVAERPQLTGKDLKSGRVRREAKAWLDRIAAGGT